MCPHHAMPKSYLPHCAPTAPPAWSPHAVPHITQWEPTAKPYRCLHTTQGIQVPWPPAPSVLRAMQLCSIPRGRCRQQKPEKVGGAQFNVQRLMTDI